MNKEETIKMETEVLLGKIGLTLEVELEKQDDAYVVNLKTAEEAPLLIGRFGETLSSLQRILEAMLFKTFQEPLNILVNVNDYRERQRARLEGIADNIAKRVIQEGKPSTLRSFSSYERKVIHEYIAKKFPDLTTYSEGEGVDRRLNVAPKNQSSEK